MEYGMERGMYVRMFTSTGSLVVVLLLSCGRQIPKWETDRTRKWVWQGGTVLPGNGLKSRHRVSATDPLRPAILWLVV